MPALSAGTLAVPINPGTHGEPPVSAIECWGDAMEDLVSEHELGSNQLSTRGAARGAGRTRRRLIYLAALAAGIIVVSVLVLRAGRTPSSTLVTGHVFSIGDGDAVNLSATVQPSTSSEQEQQVCYTVNAAGYDPATGCFTDSAVGRHGGYETLLPSDRSRPTIVAGALPRTGGLAESEVAPGGAALLRFKTRGRWFFATFAPSS